MTIIYKAVGEKTNVGKLIERKGSKLTRKINRILNDAGKQIAAKAAKLYSELAKADTDAEIVQKILKDLGIEDMSIDIVDSITPEMIKTYREAGMNGLTEVGISSTASMVDNINQAAMDYADAHGGELITDLAGTTEDALRDVLNQALDEGLSPDKLSNMIQDLGAFGDSRGDMIARTELAFAHVQGSINGWQESGVVEGKEWKVSPGCCSDCDEMDGEIVGLDEDFPNDEGADPPLHPRCECVLLAVLSQDENNQSDNTDQTDQTNNGE